MLRVARALLFFDVVAYIAVEDIKVPSIWYLAMQYG